MEQVSDRDVQFPDDDLAAAAESAIREMPESEIEQTVPVFLEIGDRRFRVPNEVLHMLRMVLRHLANGLAVTVTPYSMEVTPRQAGEILNVSRPYVMKLIRTGVLEYRRVGSHYRIPLRSVIRHRDEMRATAKDALEQMAEMDREAEASGELIPGYDY